jgi:hypothetical protein
MLNTLWWLVVVVVQLLWVVHITVVQGALVDLEQLLVLLFLLVLQLQ